MRLKELWRISTFRLAAVYGAVFIVGIVALLAVIYLRSAVYLTHRVDSILKTEADTLVEIAPAALPQRIGDALALAGAQRNIFALFADDGRPLAGNLKALPRHLKIDGPPAEIERVAGLPAARLIARHLPNGQVLVVGRDVGQLHEMRHILVSALLIGGAGAIVCVFGLGALLGFLPIYRLRRLRLAAEAIAAGDLRQRMPVSRRQDELDTFAGTVNFMLDEVERLMAEVKSSTDTIAHDLRTPLARTRANLHRLQESGAATPEDLQKAVGEIDLVLDRFRALLRLSELEARERRAGFSRVVLADVLAQAVELYQPLAEEKAVTLDLLQSPAANVEGDAKLLFESVSNLIDNAIKFTPPGGHVKAWAADHGDHVELVVEDDGPGIAEADRPAVLHRFYRLERDRLLPGSGLGLSVVGAIMRLHRFSVTLEDAAPGLRVTVACPVSAAP